MSSNKTLRELIDHVAVRPYASELFGVYQPLLGWKSKRLENRFNDGFHQDRRAVLGRLANQFQGDVRVIHDDAGDVDFQVNPGMLNQGELRQNDSLLVAAIAKQLPPYEQYKSTMWRKVITRKTIESILEEKVIPQYHQLYKDLSRSASVSTRITVTATNTKDSNEAYLTALQSQLRSESSHAGLLLYLTDGRHYEQLEQIFYRVKDNRLQAANIGSLLNPLQFAGGYIHIDNLNPRDQRDIASVALSPISVVHLFRQYFFELDSFLGSPVGHVWLSPGSTVELIEIQTRRTLVEKTLETLSETTTKSETESTKQDEISDAVKEDNKQDIKFGASVTASYASVSATSSFDYATSQQNAREESHRRMRQQTEKLSTEIRKNFKTTFRTVTETTDTSSKRYLLANSTQKLINYELRRKMRQVAVQVQDVGTYLCWQTYVDRPGESLGVANLMHIGKPADLDGLQAPDEIPMLQPFTEDKLVTIPFLSIEDTDADNKDEVYRDGIEVDNTELFGTLEKIQADFPIDCVCPRGNYVLVNIDFDGQGKPVSASRKGDIENAGNASKFTLHLDSADFQGQNSLQVKLTLHWAPAEGANNEAIKKNQENVALFNAREADVYRQAFVQNAKERIKLSHQIKARSSDTLREEERIVVYRSLIQDMLTQGVSMPDDRTRHVVAELINSIFDVDKMLYFVAPEWWRPRLRVYTQQLGETKAEPTAPKAGGISSILAQGIFNRAASLGRDLPVTALAPSTVGWGGTDDLYRDNYYITEDSDPARFGSSLGWLLQLDGDDMRNAFLNAPWVKAVIPIRPGKEEAAINWLKGVEGFNGIGDSDIYEANDLNEKDIHGQPLNGQKLIDVIMDLAKKVKKKHQDGVKLGKFPKTNDVADPALVDDDNVVTSTPIDRVYEHGFYPLKDAFRANVTDNYEVFDQWLEILPTDQVVPVEVKYDAKTGRQV